MSRVERYLDCPFKYFSAAVLRLDEEAVDEPTLGRRGRGELLHLVLRTLVEQWRAAGHHGFGEDQIDAALACARDVVEEAMDDLPAVDRQLERARLLGSASSGGLVERFVQLESERSGDAVESLLERTFDGTFSITGASGASRQVRLRGVADRVDLLADGTLRLLDYKLGRAPNAGRAVQLPVYAACAEQALAGYRRRTWSVAEASYVAFGGSRLEVPVISLGDGTPSSLGAGQARFLEAIDGIERGAFPPAPAEDRLCASCGFTAVCRKGACVVRSGSRDNAERRSGREHPAARRLAVDPSRHVVLEASAGTGKTSVLVARYVNLLGAGVDPANILAMTFTRKAAAEMRERILGTLRQAAATSETAHRQWMALRDRLSDVHITTIDAFCLSLLREFPFEADLDPGFGIADETEAPRLMEQALDRAQRIFGALVPRDEGVALLLTRLGATNLRTGLVWLLRHRLVAPRALRQFLANGAHPPDPEADCARHHDAPAAFARERPGRPPGVSRRRPDRASAISHAGRRPAAPGHLRLQSLRTCAACSIVSPSTY